MTTLYNRELVDVLTNPDNKAKLESFGFVVTASTPEGLRAQVEADLAKWKPVVEKAGIKP